MEMAEKKVTNGYYTVIAPYIMRAARKYTLSVALHHAKESCQLKLCITGAEYNASQTVELEVNEMKMVEFDIPAIKTAEYQLKLQGLKGVIYEETVDIKAKKFQPMASIQTDKGMYKPGDVVNYRVIFLDENLKPAKLPENASISFTDGKSNRIKEIKHFELIKGVYTGKFHISEYAILGTWDLTVKADGTDESGTTVNFEVDKYVLPKYEVHAEATRIVSLKDGIMQVTVKANYTYGRPVNGKVTLMLELCTGYYECNEAVNAELKAPVLIKTCDMLHGVAKVAWNVAEYAPFVKGTTPAYLTVKASVEEQFTGVKIEATANTTLYPYRYDMFCVSYQHACTYHPGKETELSVQVKHVDGALVNDIKSIARLIFTEKFSKIHYWHEEENEEPTPKIEPQILSFEGKLNEQGIGIFKVTLPDLLNFERYDHYFDIEMEYADERRELLSTRPFREPEKSDTPTPETEEPKDYFKIDITYEQDRYYAKLNEPLEFTVRSSLPLPYFCCNLIGRGKILSSEVIQLSAGTKEHKMTLTPTFTMAPNCKIFAFYIDGEGAFKHAERSFAIKVELQNQLEITAAEQVKPGAEVALHIKTAPNSFVGLLAIDQSALLLAENNDVCEYQFERRLHDFDSDVPWWRRPGTICGMVTITNAYHAQEEETCGLLKKKKLKKRSAMKVKEVVTKVECIEESRSAGSDAPAIMIRKDFAETWLFENIENEAEEFTFVKKIPDTITSWVLNGFAISPEKGIGVLKQKQNIRTFQPFFIAIRLPYAVKRGEVINVPALVFNYLEQELKVEVTLNNSYDEYDFLDNAGNVLKTKQRSTSLCIAPNASAGVSFMLRPKVIGNIMLKLTAISAICGDAINQTLKVVPEGITEYANRAYFVNLREVNEFKARFELILPQDVVPDSQHIEFEVIGDLLGPMLSNLERLVRMPRGCCEQTTSTLVPNYLVLRYLKHIGKPTTALELKILRNLETGYQHLLSYALEDGSFCSFLPFDEDEKCTGSTWLTAYVIRALYQAKQYVAIDEQLIAKGLEYLSSQQAEDGSFNESNDFYYAAYRQPLTLTASLLLTFVETASLTDVYKAVIVKASQYILANVIKSSDLHATALATYALHKAQHAKSSELLQNLWNLVKTDNDRLWWTNSEDKPSRNWWLGCSGNDVEITAYVLLTLLDTTTVQDVLPVVKWLIAQRNNYGGFSSTQDTVVGLQALIKFAEKSNYEAALMNIELSTKGVLEKQDAIAVNDGNGMILQTVELPPKTNIVDFTVRGQGTALVQISYQYNVSDRDRTPSFTISTDISKEVPKGRLQMNVCVAYTGEEKTSNMTLLEVSLPSGYIADVDCFECIRAVSGVRLIETKDAESVIVIYFEHLLKNEPKTITVVALKTFAVALQKPVPIILYDYYDTNKKATYFYEVVTPLSDICDKEQDGMRKI